MKKLLAAILLFCLPIRAMAEGSVEFGAEAMTFAGYGFSLALPAGWLALDMMETDDEISFMDESFPVLLYRMYVSGSADCRMAVIVVSFEDTEENWGIVETFGRYYGEFGEWGEMGGARAFSFSDFSADACGVFVLGDGVLIAIMGSPLSDLEFTGILSLVIDSFAFTKETRHK
ncbi:MAG: hypothetical protein FWF69_01540 [Firmicutes bacterium]|nr:hypothetical protein [Bacillota bacterium]